MCEKSICLLNPPRIWTVCCQGNWHQAFVVKSKHLSDLLKTDLPLFPSHTDGLPPVPPSPSGAVVVIPHGAQRDEFRAAAGLSLCWIILCGREMVGPANGEKKEGWWRDGVWGWWRRNQWNGDLLKFRSLLNSGSTHARDESRPPVLKRQKQNRWIQDERGHIQKKKWQNSSEPDSIISLVCMYKCVCYLHFICWTRQMDDSFSGRFDGRPIGAQHRSEGSGARRRGWSLLVTDGEMEDSIRHAISQPGTPVRRDRLGPSISLHYL